MEASGELYEKTVVTTVMSNLGFHKAMANAGISVEVTAVGDRYVLERINERGLSLGGEQSGHIIIRRLATTGDGILTALSILALAAQRKVVLSNLAEIFRSFPQVLTNVPVRHKEAALSDPMVISAMRRAEAQLGERGRLLVRASGTEELVRVMAEADTMELAQEIVTSLVTLIASRHGA